MVLNPLFAPDDEDEKHAKRDAGYVLPNRQGRTLKPIHSDLQHQSAHPAQPGRHVIPAHQTKLQNASPSPTTEKEEQNAAADLIRRKLETLYAQEPDAKAEEQIAEHIPKTAQQKRSPHQQFMYELSTSGKSLAEIQTAWHAYYAGLSDAEKHQVWQEFYNANGQKSAYSRLVAQAPQVAQAREAVAGAHAAMPQAQATLPAFPQAPPRVNQHQTAPMSGAIVVAEHVPSEKPTKVDSKHVAAIKKRIKKHVRVSENAQTKAKQHLKSLVFGLGTGSLVLLVVLFGLFNEVVITPFIQPGRSASATPIILDTSSVAPTTNPEVIIPKINVEIPVDYTQTTTDEAAVESALNDGTVHYASTSKPGEKGNVAVFGHSSNNIFNPGKYKFAFVLLHTLVPGDIFYLTYNNKVYSYRVYDKQIVSPSTVSVLDPVAGKTATATLITCDPPGTSLNRLVVWGEQISPDPSGNGNATNSATATAPTAISGNGPTLWQRLTSWMR